MLSENVVTLFHLVAALQGLKFTNEHPVEVLFKQLWPTSLRKIPKPGIVLLANTRDLSKCR